MGKSSNPPPAPDYIGAANAQGQQNITAAQTQARLFNPNINTPYGSQTVQFGTPNFDQAGYDKAMAAYQAGLGTPGNGQPQYIDDPNNPVMYDWTGQPSGGGQILNPKYVAGTAATNGGAAPTKEQFTTVSDVNTPNITQTLNPQSQAILDSQNAVKLSLSDLAGQGVKTAQSTMGTPFQFQGPPVQTSLNNNQQATGTLDTSNVAKMPVNAGQTGQDALMARLQPQIDQSRNMAMTRLANQGLVPGGEAYNNAMRIQNQSENDLRSRAALQGIVLDLSANNQGFGQALQTSQFANQGAAQNFNQGLQSGQFGNTAQQQALSQQMGLYNLPLNQVNALMSSSQIQNPQFQGYTGAGVQPAPLFNATQQQYNAGLQGYGMQNQANNNFMGGLMGMGNAAMMSPAGTFGGGYGLAGTGMGAGLAASAGVGGMTYADLLAAGMIAL